MFDFNQKTYSKKLCLKIPHVLGRKWTHRCKKLEKKIPTKVDKSKEIHIVDVTWWHDVFWCDQKLNCTVVTVHSVAPVSYRKRPFSAMAPQPPACDLGLSLLLCDPSSREVKWPQYSSLPEVATVWEASYKRDCGAWMASQLWIKESMWQVPCLSPSSSGLVLNPTAFCWVGGSDKPWMVVWGMGKMYDCSREL